MAQKKTKDAYYFPFHAKDWRSSESVALMSLAEQGAFIALLCVAWLSSDEPCTIPSDDAQIAALLRISVSDWLPIAPRVLAEFDETTSSGRLRNERLWQEYRSMRDKHKRQSQGGRTTALKRWGTSGSLAIGKQALSDSLASGSQSHSQSQLVTTTPTQDERRVLDHYTSCHPRRRWGEKDVKLVRKRLAESIPPDTLCHAISGNKSDSWHAERKKHELSYVLRDAGKIYEFAEKGQELVESVASGKDFWDNPALRVAL